MIREPGNGDAMVLYHFTGREYLGAIAHEGLRRGEVPVTPHAKDCLNAVWLTTDSTPDGHGLSDGGELSLNDKRVLGVPSEVHVRFADKRAIRIAVTIPVGDPALSHWPKWAAKRLSKKYYRALDKAGGRKSGTWFVYFGVIPPEWFSEVIDVRSSNPIDWRSLPHQAPKLTPHSDAALQAALKALDNPIDPLDAMLQEISPLRR